MLNGPGFIDDKVAHLWLVDVATGAARRLTDGPTSDDEPAWSPDGTRIAFTASRGRDHDLDYQFDVFVVEVATGRVTRITDGAGCAFGTPTWLPDGATLAACRAPLAAGRRQPQRHLALPGGWLRGPSGRWPQPLGPLRPDVRRRHGQRRHAGRGVPPLRHAGRSPPPLHGADPRLLRAVADRPGRRRRGATHGGPPLPVRLARRRRCPPEAPGSRRSARPPPRSPTSTSWTSAPTAARPAAGCAAADHVVQRGRPRGARRPRARGALGDGRRARDPGLAHPLRRRRSGASRRRSCSRSTAGRTRSTAGRPYWEFQVLAGAGISVLFTNPRGSEGYGEDFNSANLPDWGDGPMRDVMAHVDGARGGGRRRSRPGSA